MITLGAQITGSSAVVSALVVAICVCIHVARTESGDRIPQWLPKVGGGALLWFMLSIAGLGICRIWGV